MERQSRERERNKKENLSLNHLPFRGRVRSRIFARRQHTSPIVSYLWNFRHRLVRYYWYTLCYFTGGNFRRTHGHVCFTFMRGDRTTTNLGCMMFRCWMWPWQDAIIELQQKHLRRWKTHDHVAAFFSSARMFHISTLGTNWVLSLSPTQESLIPDPFCFDSNGWCFRWLPHFRLKLDSGHPNPT